MHILSQNNQIAELSSFPIMTSPAGSRDPGSGNHWSQNTGYLMIWFYFTTGRRGSFLLSDYVQ